MTREEQLRPGATFLLRVGSQYFLSAIESVAERSLVVSVPARDYPLPRMKAALDFYDDDGCTTYRTEVIRGPSAKRRSARLKRPGPPRRVVHREYTRVEINVPARFREMGTVSYHQGRVVNLSAGGLLLKTSRSQEFQRTLEIEFKLPNAPRMGLMGLIVHKAERMEGKKRKVSLYGCKFVRLDRQQRKTIVEYVRDQFGVEMPLLMTL